jgi:hypothetical protein
MDYKLGDFCWFIHYGYFIIIECKIIEIDDKNRRKQFINDPHKELPLPYLWYGLDEPVGNYVIEDELFKTKKQALEELKFRYSEAIDEGLNNLLITLDKYRKQRINFIVNTWTDLSEKEKNDKKINWYRKLPKKEYNEQWFNIESFNK